MKKILLILLSLVNLNVKSEAIKDVQSDDIQKEINKQEKVITETFQDILNNKFKKEISKISQALNLILTSPEGRKKISGLINNYTKKSKISTEKLFTAIANGNLWEVTSAILNGADINSDDNKEKVTPLMLAAELGYYTISEWLVSYKAKVNKTDANGNTALIIASCKASQLYDSHVEIVKLLIDNGADITVKNY